jgi:3-methyladenine DNA glycosylase AlkD
MQKKRATPPTSTLHPSRLTGEKLEPLISELLAVHDTITLMFWATDCAEHVLPLFQKNSPEDLRPAQAIAAGRAWTRGEITVNQARAAALACHAAARAAGDPAAVAAARAAGHAVATAHVPTHCRGASIYALKAVSLSQNPLSRHQVILDHQSPATVQAVEAEREWQYRRLQEIMKNPRKNPRLSAKQILEKLRRELRENADAHTRDTAQRFFKEKVQVYGIKTAIVSQISKKYFHLVKAERKKEIFALCRDLFASGLMEESFVACHWSYALREQFAAEDLEIFQDWLEKYINNWASCDTLCNHTVGALIEKFPAQISRLKKWTQSPNRWLKRAAAVSLIIPAKKGKFLSEALEISDLLIHDDDDLVQKCYGWLLKEESRQHQQEIFDFVYSRKTIMPRTALRYAIEKLPSALRARAMEK